VSRQVIVIGAGLAGMSATLAAHGEGADVILMARGEIGLGTNSAMANGVFADFSVFPRVRSLRVQGGCRQMQVVQVVHLPLVLPRYHVPVDGEGDLDVTMT
jgi:monoamine oxidase